MLRSILLTALLVAAPSASAQWSMSQMMAEVVPTVVEAAATDFSDLRGELLASNGTDSLWVSAYAPEGPGGPLYAQTDHRVSAGESAFWFSIPGPADVIETVFYQTVGVADTALGSNEGDDGLGWAYQQTDLDGGRLVSQWSECGQSGRVVEAIYTPTADGAELLFATVRHAEGCAEVD
ncbi:MAG: hypothetical protein CMM84_17790 [Rhodothermaceae bacterium]|nr:hypothetical protein [Rhodothermaceae bacterium]MBC13438.1 hypothetical protein [Rhodothermaceae bacterium]